MSNKLRTMGWPIHGDRFLQESRHFHNDELEVRFSLDKNSYNILSWTSDHWWSMPGDNFHLMKSRFVSFSVYQHISSQIKTSKTTFISRRRVSPARFSFYGYSSFTIGSTVHHRFKQWGIIAQWKVMLFLVKIIIISYARNVEFITYLLWVFIDIRDITIYNHQNITMIRCPGIYFHQDIKIITYPYICKSNIKFVNMI